MKNWVIESPNRLNRCPPKVDFLNFMKSFAINPMFFPLLTFARYRYNLKRPWKIDFLLTFSKPKPSNQMAKIYFTVVRTVEAILRPVGNYRITSDYNRISLCCFLRNIFESFQLHWKIMEYEKCPETWKWKKWRKSLLQKKRKRDDLEFHEYKAKGICFIKNIAKVWQRILLCTRGRS